MSTYGYSVYDNGYVWQGNLYPTPKPNLYGFQPYSQFDVTPFNAVARDYTTIMLTWHQPQGGTMFGFRLLANRYGFPVDQNDGDVLIDSASFPGTAYADQQVVPGTYHYYGIYVKVATMPDVWQRCAFAVCLAPVNHATGAKMFSLLPNYFRELQDGELTQDAAGNQYLQQYLDVIGWGMDYLRTQYDLLFEHLNDPMVIPLGDMVNLAGQLGMPFQPETPAHITRKALANWTHVCQERGTPGGLSEHITLLTGYPVDLQSGRNKMLENDQAMPLDPAPNAWSASISYALNELVTYSGFIYKCIQATTNLGNPPSGSTSANTWWTVQQNVTDPASTLANSATVGGLNTWQVLYPSLDSGGSYAIPAGSLVTTMGLPDPVTGTGSVHNAFSVFNKSGSTQDVMLRSVSQLASDRTGTNTNMSPDPLQAVRDGIPIPRITTSTNGWVPAKRYATNEIVLYNGILYQALRASSNAPPPSPHTPLNANPYFETDASHWSTATGSVAQSATVAFQGSESLRLTPNGTSASVSAISENVPVIPGATYNASGWVNIPGGYSQVLLAINWTDAFGQYISTSLTSVTSVASSTWTSFSLTATAPANAATANFGPLLQGTPANTVLSYWDAMVLACEQTPEWCVMSRDARVRQMMSAYGYGTGATAQMVPFVEFYDESGKLITSNGLARVTARTAVAGTPGGTPSLTYDSFGLGTGTFLNGRTTDSRDQTWTVKTGSWQVSGFNGGSVYPFVAATRSVATVTSAATGIWLGVTFGSTVPSGTDAGIVFRMVDLTSYWRAGMTGLYKVTGSSAALVGNYSTPCAPGDRLVVQLSGNNITVFRNGSQVLTTTDSYNSTATIHGIAVEAVTI